ncbi:hypothetical protein [Pontibacter chinhatensis]|uniref:hypothetical protein n=1 Tax=Pontibacter chinhatensis TaxID=1436961 RepID=UPI000B80776D|nr:hypothetical protein [Pontibacter chinhatensis]
MVLPKAGLNGLDSTFVQSSTFFLQLNFYDKNPRLRQYLYRWVKLAAQNSKQIKMDNQTLLLLSVLGVIVFSFIAGYFYRYADGKFNIQEGDKKKSICNGRRLMEPV